MLDQEARAEAARTLLRLAGRDHHDPEAVRLTCELATHRRRLYTLALGRLERERVDLLAALNDLNRHAVRGVLRRG